MQPARYRPLSISQNFLHRPALVDRVLDASSIRAGDLVFDLGAGAGLITDRLAQRGCRVVAVEKDLELATRLHARFDDAPAIHVRHADMLTMPFPRRPYKVFANIPFNVTAAIVKRLTQARNPPEDSYLVVQAEAADRFAGQPRGTLVAALLQPWFEPTLVYRFDRTDFAPAPRVDVVMLRLRKRGPPLVPSTDARMYRDFVVSVFTGRHGSLRDNLRDLVGWQRARLVTAGLGLDQAATPSEISFACWLDLFAIFRAAAAQRTLSGVVGAERRLVRQQRRLHKPQRTSTWSNPRTVIECRPPPVHVGDAASPILPQHAPRPSRPATTPLPPFELAAVRLLTILPRSASLGARDAWQPRENRQQQQSSGSSVGVSDCLRMGTYGRDPAVVEAIRRATGLEIGSLTIDRRSAMPHQANRLYDVWTADRHLIAKEYLGDVERDGPENEYRGLQVVQPLDIAPQPVFFDRSVGRVVVYAFLDGQMWDRRVLSAAELEALADILVAVQALPGEGLWVAHGQALGLTEAVARLRAPIERYAAWASSGGAEQREAAEVCRSALERGLANGLPLIPDVAPLCFCRSDARFANVIARPDGRTGLVDWEDSGLRDPARELADLLHHPNQEDLLGAEGWRPFLDRYLPSRGADPGFDTRWRGYQALFPVYWLGLLLSEGMRRTESDTLAGWLVNDLDPNLRLRRYVARSLAWPSLDPADSLNDLAALTFF